jgi:Flp pilus assembly protein TadD
LSTLPRNLSRLVGLLALVLASGPLRAAGEGDEIRSRVARGDLAGALALVDAAVTRRPDDAQLRFLRGVVLMDLGRDAAALEVFETLNQAYPELPEPLNNIGLLHARAGRLEAARASLLLALRSDPTHRAARANLAQVHLMLAVRGWEQLALSDPGDTALARRLEAARALLAPAVR